MTNIHRYKSYAFKESFNLSNFRTKYQGEPGSIVRKDVLIQRLDDGAIYYFNFGAVTFYNIPEERQKEVLQSIEDITKTGAQATINPLYEDFVVEVDSKVKSHVQFNKLVIDELTTSRNELIAYTVAQSIAMDYYEALITEIWDEVNALNNALRKTAKVTLWINPLYKKIGYVVAIRNAIIGVLHLLDRPDLVWEDKLMDGLYSDLRAIFDLNERLQAVQHKLDSIQDTLEILIDTSRDGRQFILESAIVILFIIDVIISLTH